MKTGDLYFYDQTGIFEKCWVLITHSNPCQGLIIWGGDKRQSSMITDQDFRKYNGKLVGRNVKMRSTL
jgi:hypothetical protein